MGLFSSIGDAFGFGGGSGGGVTGEQWGQMDENLKALKDRASGNYNSQAQAQLQMAEANQRRQIQDASANMRALNPAEQAMSIQQGSAELGANMAGQSANLRAQEDMANQQMYNNALNNKAQLQLSNNAQALADSQARAKRKGAFIGAMFGGQLGNMAGGESKDDEGLISKGITNWAMKGGM